MPTLHTRNKRRCIAFYIFIAYVIRKHKLRCACFSNGVFFIFVCAHVRYPESDKYKLHLENVRQTPLSQAIFFLNHQNKRQNHCEEGLTLEEPENGEKGQHD